MAASPSNRPLRILVVEDHAETAEALALLIERHGHDVHTARTLADARSACDVETFDVILCDITLPDGDGKELARAVRSNSPPTKLIAFTGHGMPDEKREIFAAGFDVHLLKPVDLETLDQYF
jgi:CheY-like chemotaxis protein